MPARQVVRYARSIGPADVGRRVSVRRRLAEGGMADAVGVLDGWFGGVLHVRRRDGSVVAIAEETLVAGKVVPPPPAVPGRYGHASVGVRELEEVAALGWRATDTERLGEWLLRAAGGWTGRANSALPLGDPGLPLPEAVAAVRAWYTARGLPPRFQVPLPLAAGLDGLLETLGWTLPYGPAGVVVMTADVEDVPEPATGGALPPVTLAPQPGDGWLGTYRYRGGPLPGDAVRVLLHADAPVFAEVTEAGATLAVGRASVDGAWVGITAMQTAEGARRRGLGTHVLRALVAYGRRAGARHVYLQVEASNTAAIGMYGSAGLRPHHAYHYRVGPGAGSAG